MVKTVSLLLVMTSAVTKTKEWVRDIVIGLNLCPFAASVLMENKIRFAASSAKSTEDVIGDALEEAMRLLATPEEELSTTLVIYTNALSDFEEYLDTPYLLEDVLNEAGTEGLLQIASFHPKYQFDGEAEDAVSHFTNRSPYPVFHFLRESQVKEAVDSHPDTTVIPGNNVIRLNSLGPEEVAKMWKNFLDL